MDATRSEPPLPSQDIDAAHGATANAPEQPSSFRRFRELLMVKRFETRDNTPVLVRPGLFIGSLGAATNLAALQAQHITHILCVAANLPLPFPDLFIYERLALADEPSAILVDVIPAAMAFLKTALAGGGTVLVHCFVGRSRSASVLLAFLMAEHAMTLDAAMALLQTVRPQVRPNRGFLGQLRAFEKELEAQRARAAAASDDPQ